MTKSRTGAEIVMEALIAEKVTHMWGILGGSVLDIFDQFPKYPQINFTLTRHEQGAVHAADGYARATGEVGVCIATSGPGATNLTTGLLTAHLDSIPMVAITGQVHTFLIGNDAFQEADTTGITRSVTKHNYLVQNIDELPRLLKEAFYVARTGRPGPVLIDIPKDIQQQKTSVPYPKTAQIRSYNPTVKGHPRQIAKAAKAIEKAKKPLLYVGGGAISANASKELGALIKKAKIPVTTTLMAMGAYPVDNKLNLGMPGMHGTFYANEAIQNCDCLIAVGSRFDDRVTGKLNDFAPNAKTIIHMDIDPSSISKNVQIDIPVVGDIKTILAELNSIIEPGNYKEWQKEVETCKKENPLRYEKMDSHLMPQFVIEKISEVTKGEALVVTEVGQHQMWAAQYYNFKKPRHFLTSGGLGTMGYGFPASLGAKAAFPDKIVVDIAGDGSFQMNVQELATAVDKQIPVIIAIMNNGVLGMVRQWQEMFYKRNYSQVLLMQPEQFENFEKTKPGEKPPYTPDFVKLAEAYGAVGMRVFEENEVIPALEKAIALNCVVVIDFIVSSEANVFPMVPAGASLSETMKGPALL